MHVPFSGNSGARPAGGAGGAAWGPRAAPGALCPRPGPPSAPAATLGWEIRYKHTDLATPVLWSVSVCVLSRTYFSFALAHALPLHLLYPACLPVTPMAFNKWEGLVWRQAFNYFFFGVCVCVVMAVFVCTDVCCGFQAVSEPCSQRWWVLVS